MSTNNLPEHTRKNSFSIPPTANKIGFFLHEPDMVVLPEQPKEPVEVKLTALTKVTHTWREAYLAGTLCLAIGFITGVAFIFQVKIAAMPYAFKLALMSSLIIGASAMVCFVIWALAKNLQADYQATVNESK